MRNSVGLEIIGRITSLFGTSPYSYVKMFCYISNEIIKQPLTIFKTKLRSYLIEKWYYTLDEFFNNNSLFGQNWTSTYSTFTGKYCPNLSRNNDRLGIIDHRTSLFETSPYYSCAKNLPLTIFKRSKSVTSTSFVSHPRTGPSLTSSIRLSLMIVLIGPWS